MKSFELSKIYANEICQCFDNPLQTRDGIKYEIQNIIRKLLPVDPPDPYWVLEIGDEPDSEIVTGPFDSFKKAMEVCLTHTYYTWRLPQEGSGFVYWSGQISGLYLIQKETKPTYENDIRFKHTKKDR